MNEAEELELEALVRQRRTSDARLNRALGELLGSGEGGDEALLAIDEVEGVLRSLADLINRLN
jgi:hypothetical protein